MTHTNKQWQDSPARKLTLGNYLPESAANPSASSIADSEIERQTSVLDLVASSGEELGRTSDERLLYLETAGEKYGQVSLLAVSEELNKMLAALKKANSTLDQQDEAIKAQVKTDMMQLAFLTENLFGTVNEERYAGIVGGARMNATRILADDNAEPALKESARRVLGFFPDVEAPATEKKYAPSKELLDAWRPAIEKRYAPLLELVDDSKEAYTSEELRTLFEQGIQELASEYGLDASDWKVEIGRNSINVDHEKKIVWVPPEKGYSLERTKALFIHEIGGHLLRSLRGEQTGDALLSGDMPGRATDEEALFVAFEQILSGAPKESGLTYYVAVALANGTLGGDRVPLKDLAPDVLDYLSVTRGRVLNDKEKSEESHRVHRVTRGMPSFSMDGELYQVTYNADLKYALGQEHAVEFLEANIDRMDEALDEVLSGRFAYSNPKHITYALSKAAEYLS